MNTNWKKLKQSSNGIPTHDSLIPYVLEVLKNGEEATNRVIRERVIKLLGIPKEILAIKYPDYPDSESVILNRFSFAYSDLYKANAIQRPKRGIYKITDNGLTLLEKYGETLTQKVLQTQPAYIEYERELELRNKRKGIAAASEAEEADEAKIEVGTIVELMNNEVATELLDKVRQVSPDFFERLVVDLLVKMGYSGEDGDAKVTSHSNDGGIDGIINQDPLGTSTVYIQAKRYKESNVIGRPEIQSFYGALAGVKADRGVFITTSTFTKGAQEYANNQGLVLIDGIHLTELMLKFGVGVEEAEKHVIYRMDNDYFNPGD